MSTIVGIILGLILISSSILSGGGYQIFLNLDALMIVVGGTLAATLISYPFYRVINFFILFLKLFKEQSNKQLELVLIHLAELGQKAFQDSVFCLEEEIKQEKNYYIRVGMKLLVNDTPTQHIIHRYQSEADGIRGRHKEGIQLFSFMGRIAPSFGLVGTLIGLINMLRGIGATVSPETLGPSMAVALVTTLYGAFLAFFIFIPASEKLKTYSEQELIILNVVKDAMIMIKNGESGRDIGEMLQAYLPEKNRRVVMQKILK
ncbi:MAG: MotA/TolQ/ExbB proton channel family protein [gamma proteobacterium symbiont of Taylorina sp.]|nr:MotA/TolQ/ExbB proton channel family protein [gamma proteobacterium symbiont of Taylorina sp.]